MHQRAENRWRASNSTIGVFQLIFQIFSIPAVLKSTPNNHVTARRAPQLAAVRKTSPKKHGARLR